VSAHLLQISAERLAALPEGVLARVHESGWDGRTFRRHGGVVVRFDHGAAFAAVRGSAWLVLTDTVTAAVVAARLIWPWLSADRARRAAHRDVEHVVRAAERMQPLTPDDLDTLARLARATIGAVHVAPPTWAESVADDVLARLQS